MSTSVLCYLIFLGVVIVERFYELRLSARNAKLAFAEGAIEVGQAHFRVMSLLHTLFFFGIVTELYWRQPVFSPLLGYAALVMSILSQGLRYWAITTLGKRWNVRIIVLPNGAPVTDGPYRWIRHPNYVAVVLELFFLPLIHGCWVTAILFSALNAGLLWVRINAEEEALGSLYQEAFQDRPRFFPTE
jgi:methyltransferase